MPFLIFSLLSALSDNTHALLPERMDGLHVLLQILFDDVMITGLRLHYYMKKKSLISREKKPPQLKVSPGLCQKEDCEKGRGEVIY